MRTRQVIACGLAALSLVAVGCSEKESEESAADLREESGETRGALAEAQAPPETSGALKDKPVVRVPPTPPPRALQTRDIVVGKGATATAGRTITANYVGVSYSDGKEFDTSFGREPLELTLGAGGVIPGVVQGLEGMKVGGRRELIIPPELGYGPQGQPPVIKPNETLIFVVDLLSVK